MEYRNAYISVNMKQFSENILIGVKGNTYKCFTYK